MTTNDNITITLSAKHYQELLGITHAMRTLASFFDETDVDFPATDLTPALHSLGFKMSAICENMSIGEKTD